MRVIVVADIHGNNEKLRKALKSVSLKKTDKLILLGDLIDRGKNTKDVLDTIILLKKSGFEDIIIIRGNHEQMLLDSVKDENKEYVWLKNGGDKTLQSFRVNFSNQIPQLYIDLIESSVYYYEYLNYLFVHAGINFELDNPFKDIQTLLWTRDMSLINFRKSKFSDKKIIHGHTPIERSKIIESFTKIEILNLDNGVYLEREGYGKLTIVDLTNQKINFI
ncbi:putative Serine/threonine-protein phosphatase 1 [Sphingobacterium sp. PM2-P1-29]|nr:putative Serine/threonine-protein phosphatase 1 [Sphingobacterium sp. PM2-P1-29]